MFLKSGRRKKGRRSTQPAGPARPVSKPARLISLHQTGRFANRPVQFYYCARPGPAARPDKTGLASLGSSQAGFIILFQLIGFKLILDLFWRGKLGNCGMDLFITGIRSPPLYIWEDHGQLRNPTSNWVFTSITPFYPTFPISCYLLCLPWDPMVL